MGEIARRRDPLPRRAHRRHGAAPAGAARHRPRARRPACVRGPDGRREPGGRGQRADRAQAAARLRADLRLLPAAARRGASMRAGYLSGGEQQMLAIGRALLGKPTLMLLDEPSLGLAPLVVEDIFEIIARINREQGVAMLLVEQNAMAASASRTTATSWKAAASSSTGPATSCVQRPRRAALLSRLRRQCGRAGELPRRQALQAAQAVAVVSGRCRHA